MASEPVLSEVEWMPITSRAISEGHAFTHANNQPRRRRNRSAEGRSVGAAGTTCMHLGVVPRCMESQVQTPGCHYFERGDGPLYCALCPCTSTPVALIRKRSIAGLTRYSEQARSSLSPRRRM